MQQFTLLVMPICMSVEELQPLPEMAKEVQQPEGGQEVCHLLIPGILNVTGIHVQVSHKYELPPPGRS